MKKLLILLSLGIIYSAHARNNRQLDTIYASSTMTMALFFPSDIKQGITGSENFVFTYNREKQQNLGLLKAVKGGDSNLLVITTDGSVYSYILKYTDSLVNPNRFISTKESIGNERKVQKKEIEVNKNSSIHNTQDLLRKSCESLLKLPDEKNSRKKEGGIVLSLKNLKYHGDNVFLQFEIENKSEERFDYYFLKIFKINGNKKRNGSYQEIELHPIYIHDKPFQILPNTKVTVVYVMPKFYLDKTEKLEVRLQELNTTRAVKLIYR